MTDVVWLTGGYPWTGDPVGGIFFQTQAQALARLGLAVTVVSPAPATPWPLRLARARWRLYATAPREANDGAVSVVRPAYPAIPRQPSWAHPERWMADAAWRSRGAWTGARLVHGHYSVIGLAAWRLARRAGLPLVLTFHGDDINTWPGEHPRQVAELTAAASEAAAVFAVSGALADRVRAVTGVEAVALPIGCDHRSISAAALPRDDARESLGFARNRVVVLFVGNLLPQKGVRELASAITRLGDPFLGVFVGAGPLAGYGTDEPAGRGSLLYRGAMPHADVIRHMCAADVLVLPSFREGMPTVLIEAGSLGLPVIASAVGGIPELLGSDRGSVLANATSGGVIAALTEFVERPEQAQAAATRLRAFVRAEYDVDRNAARLLAHYAAIVGGLPLPAPPGDGEIPA